MKMTLNPAVLGVTDWKKAFSTLLRQDHGAEGVGIVVFHGQQHDRAQDEESHSHGNHHLAVQRQLPEASLLEDVPDHEEAEAAEDDERCYGEDHQRVVLIGGEAATTDDIEAAVVEGGHGVKYRLPQGCRRRAEVLREPDVQHDGSKALTDKREERDAHEQ